MIQVAHILLPRHWSSSASQPDQPWNGPIFSPIRQCFDGL